MNHMNYMTFAITNICNFRCPYCCSNGKGEAQFSTLPNIDPIFVGNVTRVATEHGIRRFRLSGGEPFMHRDIGEIARAITAHDIDELVIDTNASRVADHQGILSRPPRRTKFVCSIDSLDESGYDFHSGITGARSAALDNIRLLAERGLLKRINMVITRRNAHEVEAMAAFCRDLGVYLKLSDVGIRRNQIGVFDDIYQPMEPLKQRLAQQGDVIHDADDYSQGFGTPCHTFQVDTDTVKVKDSANGARFNMERSCGTCTYFPCSEGLYMITAMPDGTFSGCQSNGYHHKLGSGAFQALRRPNPDAETLAPLQAIFSEMKSVIEQATHINTTLAQSLRVGQGV